MKIGKFVLSIIAFIAIIGIVFVSCQKEGAIENKDGSPMEVTPVGDQAKIDYLAKELGFDPKTIEVQDSFLVVEGDMLFNKADFWKLYQLPKDTSRLKTHYRYKYLVTVTSTIRIKINSDVPSTWKTAIRSAISKWNGLGRLSFVEVTSNPHITVTYQCGFSSNKMLAAGAPPSSNGSPGSTIAINKCYNGASISSSQRLRAMVHEMGHTIGFTHTDGYSGVKVYTYTSCDNMVDVASVMVSEALNWTDFTYCDKKAYYALY